MKCLWMRELASENIRLLDVISKLLGAVTDGKLVDGSSCLPCIQIARRCGCMWWYFLLAVVLRILRNN